MKNAFLRDITAEHTKFLASALSMEKTETNTKITEVWVKDKFMLDHEVCIMSYLKKNVLL